MTLSILVADTDAAFRTALCAGLRARGYAVLEAAGGPAAIRMLGETQPDIVVTEILMPEADGFEAIEALRARPAPSLAPLAIAPLVVAMCRNPNYAGLDLLLLASRLGADATLAKPFDANLLIETIRAARAGPRTVPGAA